MTENNNVDLDLSSFTVEQLELMTVWIINLQNLDGGLSLHDVLNDNRNSMIAMVMIKNLDDLPDRYAEYDVT